jgi:CubicO group peptidase (beta-lactamase class C family)
MESGFAVIDAYVTAKMNGLGIPGMALGIVQGGRIVHLRGFGVADETGRPITAQTPFRIGSITKSFTALAIMQLAEAGKVELDAPVQRYLPWFRVADEAASGKITVRHLLNQTSGLSTLAGNAYWDSLDGLEATVRSLRSMELSQPVGAGFQYSNVNYSIAGLIVEAASGQTYSEYIAQHIFMPLEMRHSATATAPSLAAGLAMGHLYSLGRMVADIGVEPPAYLPAGFVSASVEDMSRYAVAQLNAGRYGNATVLSAKGIAQLHHPAIPVGEIHASLKNTYYGMGWVIGPINGTPAIWHNGDTGRYHAMLIMAPERGTGIVLLANASGLEYLVAVDDIAKGVLSLLNNQPPPASSMAHLFRTLYWIILLTPLLLLIGIVKGWRRWRRGDIAAVRNRSHDRRKPIWRMLLVVILNLAVALFFLFGMPLLTGLPISTFRILYPDLGYALIVGILIGIAWSGVYTALVLLARHRSAWRCRRNQARRFACTRMRSTAK